MTCSSSSEADIRRDRNALDIEAIEQKSHSEVGAQVYWPCSSGLWLLAPDMPSYLCERDAGWIAKGIRCRLQLIAEANLF
jgi:hypothetical protein